MINGIMPQMKFVALYRDVGPSADGRVKSLGMYNDFDSAWRAVRHDTRMYLDRFNEGDVSLVCENEILIAMTEDGVRICEWETLCIAEE